MPTLNHDDALKLAKIVGEMQGATLVAEFAEHDKLLGSLAEWAAKLREIRKALEYDDPS